MPAAPIGNVTALLLQWGEKKPKVAEQLIGLVYGDLRRIAARAMKSERRHLTLQPTALVHETYQKLLEQKRVHWQNRRQFFAVAATLMRRILVDHARRRRALRRGGDVELAAVDAPSGWAKGPDVDLIALDDALTELAGFDATQARIVELRFFGGLSVIETAEALGISRATVDREWAMARAWLHSRLAA